MKSALQAHRDALAAAWDITDPDARNDALHAADRTYRDSAKQANYDLRTSTKAADRQFKMDRRACTSGNDNGEHKDRGEHNGLFKERDHEERNGRFNEFRNKDREHRGDGERRDKKDHGE